MVQSRSSVRIEGLNRLIAQVMFQEENLITEELMNEIGVFLSQSILERTGRGKDIEGQDFEPYSPKYRLFRMKTGHPVNIVNLFFTGSMLSSLTHTAFADRVEVYFMDTYGKTPSGKSSKVSNPQKAFFLNEKRDFFGISSEEESTISDMIFEHVRNILNER